VPLETLPGDRFRYHENGRKIIGERSRKTYSIGDAVRVRLDRADTLERKLQFALAQENGRNQRGRRKR
jgi:ribonuclease R